MATLYIPEDYPDLITALIAASNGDEIVLDTSLSMSITDYTSALTDITIRAATGKTPVLDHTLASTFGLGWTGDNWSITGVRFRNTVHGSGGYAIFPDGVTGLTLTDCTFEGSEGAISGEWAGVIQSCEFRHIGGSVSSTTATNAYRACTFLRCTPGNLILGTATTVDNCTFVQTVCDFSMVNVAVIRNCIAQACTADLATGVIFKASGVCANNNAFDCTASANFAGTQSGNTTVDPLFLDIGTDLRLEWDSPCVGTGTSASAATVDANGNAFLSTISKGACETLRVAQSLGTFPTYDTVRFYVSGGQTVEDIEATYEWTIEASDMGVRNAVLAVGTFDPGGGEIPGEPIALTLWPGISPGGEYTVHATSGTYGQSQYTLTASTGLTPPEVVGVYRYVAGLGNAFGRAMFDLCGVPETKVAGRDFGVDDTTMFVQSTLDFPDAGALWCQETRFTYTSKTDAAFHGLTTANPRIVAIPEGTRVVAEERSYVPDP